MVIDEQKLQAFMGKAVGDIGAAASAVMALIGDELGLYKALSKKPMTSQELAKATKTAERYVREWLGNQAAGGYLEYDAKTKKYYLTPEQSFALADENSPAFIQGAFQVVSAMFKAQPKLAKNFKTGKGMGWGEHDAALFHGTERFFRPNYKGNLITSWIPSLHGVEGKLKKGALVADVGCGYGASTILMAEHFPKSKFIGFDFHPGSIAMAKKRAKEQGLRKNISFKVARSTDYPGKNYDLVTHFDCLHDMGDPKGAAQHVLRSLHKDGTWMVVEPNAGDAPEHNHNPVGRVFYAASTCICVPASLAHSGPALGAQAGEAVLSNIILASGFTRVRRATQTPFNMVLEARP